MVAYTGPLLILRESHLVMRDAYLVTEEELT
jgi:hypothetical protein